MIIKYKLNYTFQNPNDKDYIFKSEKHSINPSLEIVKYIIPKNNSSSTIVTKTSPSSFPITTLGSILNQGYLGSCVSNAFAFCINTQTINHFSISRLYHYLICRIIQNSSIDQDDGTTIRTGCQSIAKWGAVSENTNPYYINNFSKFPSLSILQSAKFFKKFTYTFITQDLTSLKMCIYTYKVPIIFGIMIYSSFYNTGSNGIVPTPNITKDTLEGGHCMNIIGYDDVKKWFICVNSWGKSFGNNGKCYISYSYILNSDLAGDFCFTKFIY